MVAKTIFKRYELKYVLDRCQYDAVEKALQEHMVPDRYGHSSIRNVYLDTDDFLLARRSIEKPLYKEKLRLRSYGAADEDEDIFVELTLTNLLILVIHHVQSSFGALQLDSGIGKVEDFFAQRCAGPVDGIAEIIAERKVTHRLAPALHFHFLQIPFHVS